MTTRRISEHVAPAIGDIRLMGRGDVIVLTETAERRRDWARYVDAISCAVTRGAEVIREWERR